MGKRYDQTGPDQARSILEDLAASPKTAEHLSRKLAAHFVADNPPPALVARLKTTYIKSNGDLSAMAETLIDAPEAWEPQQRKFKTPYEFVVSGYRAAAASPKNPAKEVIQPLTVLGQRPFAAVQPNGWSDLAADWAAPGAMVERLTWASRFAESYAPTETTPVEIANAVLGAQLTSMVKTALSRAESRFEAFAVLLMSPEFQRR